MILGWLVGGYDLVAVAEEAWLAAAVVVQTVAWPSAKEGRLGRGELGTWLVRAVAPVRVAWVAVTRSDQRFDSGASGGFPAFGSGREPGCSRRRDGARDVRGGRCLPRGDSRGGVIPRR